MSPAAAGDPRAHIPPPGPKSCPDVVPTPVRSALVRRRAALSASWARGGEYWSRTKASSSPPRYQSSTYATHCLATRVCEWKSMIARRSPRRPTAASRSAYGPAIAHSAVSASSVHVFSIRVTRHPNSISGQALATIHHVASPVPASSSSAAANIIFWESMAERKLFDEARCADGGKSCPMPSELRTVAYLRFARS